MKRHGWPLSQMGYSLLEVMIAVFVISVAIGSSALLSSYAAKNSSYINTVAVAGDSMASLANILSSEMVCRNNFPSVPFAVGPSSVIPVDRLQYFQADAVPAGFIMRVGEAVDNKWFVQAIELRPVASVSATEILSVLSVRGSSNPSEGLQLESLTTIHREIPVLVTVSGGNFLSCRTGADKTISLKRRACSISSNGELKWDENSMSCVSRRPTVEFTQGDPYRATCDPGYEVVSCDSNPSSRYRQDFDALFTLVQYTDGVSARGGVPIARCSPSPPTTCNCTYPVEMPINAALDHTAQAVAACAEVAP